MFYFNDVQRMAIKRSVKRKIVEAEATGKSAVYIDVKDFLKYYKLDKKRGHTFVYKNFKIKTNFTDDQINDKIMEFDRFLVEENIK